jgi:hypothetical protein
MATANVTPIRAPNDASAPTRAPGYYLFDVSGKILAGPLATLLAARTAEDRLEAAGQPVAGVVYPAGLRP